MSALAPVKHAAAVSYRLDIHDHCRRRQSSYGRVQRGLGSESLCSVSADGFLEEMTFFHSFCAAQPLSALLCCADVLLVNRFMIGFRPQCSLQGVWFWINKFDFFCFFLLQMDFCFQSFMVFFCFFSEARLHLMASNVRPNLCEQSPPLASEHRRSTEWLERSVVGTIWETDKILPSLCVLHFEAGQS